MGLVPEVPIVGGAAGSNVEAVRWLVELDLVFPLLVVDGRGGAAAAVHGDEEVPAVLGLGAEGALLPLQLVGADFDRVVLPLF